MNIKMRNVTGGHLVMHVVRASIFAVNFVGGLLETGMHLHCLLVVPGIIVLAGGWRSGLEHAYYLSQIQLGRGLDLCGCIMVLELQIT